MEIHEHIMDIDELHNWKYGRILKDSRLNPFNIPLRSKTMLLIGIKKIYAPKILFHNYM